MSEPILEWGTKQYRAVPLKFKQADLAPVLSEQNVQYHYDVHTKNYAKGANASGDEFNIAGIELHNIWWASLTAPHNKKPSGDLLELIEKKHTSFEKFKEEWRDSALEIQGSGWVALSYTGRVFTIRNHARFDGIVMLLDMWEHSFYPTYGPDKKSYIENMWKIYDWDAINKRLVSIQKEKMK